MALFNIGFVIFPDLTQLDFTGPLQVLSRVPQSATHIVAKSEAPVPAIAGWASCQRTPLRIVRPSTCSVSRAEATESSRRSAIGATHEKGRVVRDGNVITAGGVTSGIDFGLTVAAEIAGERAAQTIQLGIEYDPAPPFDAGHPDRAPAAIKSALLSGRYDEPRSAFRAGIDKASRL